MTRTSLGTPAHGETGGNQAITRRRLSRTLSPARWGEYRRLLQIALDQGYAVLSLEAWLDDPSLAGGRPALLLRHDVDQHPAAALRMAAIEADLGVLSTWYFRWRTADPHVVDAIREHGHAVGLHYETLTRELLRRGLGAADAPALRGAARELLRTELAAFDARHGPARSACPHGDTRMPGVDNGVLLLGEDWGSYGLRWDAKAAMRSRDLDVWVTDRSVAGGRWKDGLDPIDLLVDRRSPMLAVIHPNNWSSGPALWSDRVLPGPRRTGSDTPALSAPATPEELPRRTGTPGPPRRTDTLGPLPRADTFGPLHRFGPQAVLAVGLIANLILLLAATRHLGFFQDDFLFILEKRGWGPGTFLDAMNGHLSLMPVAIFKLLFVTVGVHHSWPYRFVLALIDSACVVLVYALLAPRAGRAIALIPAFLLLMLGAGAGSTDLIWITQIGFLLSLTAGLAALLCLARGDLNGDRAAAALLGVSLASSSPGLAMCAGALTHLLATRTARRRYWVVAAPLALYALWYLGYGTQGLALSNAPHVPNYLVNIASSGFGALAGLSGQTRASFGVALLVGAVILLAARVWRGRPLPPLGAAGVAGAVTFWILVALTRAQTDNSGNSRYLYPSAVFILLALGALLGWRRTTGRGAAVVACGLVLIGLGNLRVLNANVDGRGKLDGEVRAVLGASEMIGPAGAPSFAPHPPFVPHLELGPYLAAVHQLGSPAESPGQIESAPPADRQLADQTLIAGERIGLESPPASCPTVTPTAAGAAIELTVAPGRSLYLALRGHGAVTVYVRRLAASYPSQPLGTLPSGDGPRGLGFPIDASPIPWHVRLLPTTVTVTCLASA